MADWTKILSANGIPYQEAGKFEVAVGCPWCGASDTSQHHLAISLRGRGYRCFRNPVQHRGRSNVRLLTALLRCSEEHARELLGEEGGVSLPAQDTFKDQWRKQLGLAETSCQVTELTLPREFKALDNFGPFARMFWNYLYDRGYTKDQATWASEAYNLYYSTSGPYARRLVIPVYDSTGKLMTWTGRSIQPDAQIRYKTLATDQAVSPPGNLLLGLPLLWKAVPATCLVICEGPFDAIAISALGHRHGVWGTCLFGVYISEAQADLLCELERRFVRIRFGIDPDANLKALSLRDRLPRRCLPMTLPEGLGDPGELIGAEFGSRFVQAL